LSAKRPAFLVLGSVGTKGGELEWQQQRKQLRNRQRRPQRRNSFHLHTHIFLAGGEILQPSFCGLLRIMKRYFAEKFKLNF